MESLLVPEGLAILNTKERRMLITKKCVVREKRRPIPKEDEEDPRESDSQGGDTANLRSVREIYIRKRTKVRRC